VVVDRRVSQRPGRHRTYTVRPRRGVRVKVRADVRDAAGRRVVVRRTVRLG
jgi:hypothetical protein